MKILILAPSYSPNNGGVEKHILMVVREFKKQGHQVVILVRHGNRIPPRQTVEGVEVWRLPANNSLPILTAWYLAHPTLFRNIDVIHSHDFYPRHLRKLIRGAKWIHTFHGYEGYPLDPGAIASRQIVRREVGVCFGVGAFIEKWYGTKLDHIIYGAVEIPANLQPGEQSDILYYGRLESDTGFSDYLEGFKIIHERHPHLTMLVLGGGSLAEWAHDYARKYHLPVKLAGWTPDVMPSLLATKTAFVSGYLTILEASLLNKPIVAHYGTPIKKDYLECHPMTDSFSIGHSPETIAAAYESVGKIGPAGLRKAHNWAQTQTWARVAGQYLESYAD